MGKMGAEEGAGEKKGYRKTLFSFLGHRTIIARYVAKWGIAQMCLCEAKYQGGGIAPFWGSASLP